jgi:hypothetical protein
VLSNDRVIRYDTLYFQVTRQSHQAPARRTVLVRENADGAIELRYRGRLVRWSEIPAPPLKSPCPPPAARPRTGIGHPPAADRAGITLGAAATTTARSGPSRRVAGNDKKAYGPSPGDISISLRTGTFLFRLDTLLRGNLTAPAPLCYRCRLDELLPRLHALLPRPVCGLSVVVCVR